MSDVVDEVVRVGRVLVGSLVVVDVLRRIISTVLGKGRRRSSSNTNAIQCVVVVVVVMKKGWPTVTAIAVGSNVCVEVATENKK
jgi:hypothetical protein